MVFGGFVSVEQKKELISFMEEHPELKSGKFSTNFTFKTAQQLWMHLTEMLNALPGAKKEWKQRRKTWQDLKSLTKKCTQIRNHKLETGEGPPIDEQIVNIIGTVPVEGDSQVSKSQCEFVYEDCHIEENILQIEESDADHQKENYTEKSKIDSNLESEPESCLRMLRESQPACLKWTSSAKQYTYRNSHRNIEYGTPTSAKRKCTSVSAGKKIESREKVQRLDKAQEANNKLVRLTEEKNAREAKDSREQLDLFKRDVEAKESILKSLALLVQHFIKKRIRVVSFC